MKPNGKDETTKLHSCAVLRYMTKGVPKEISPSDMSTLTGLLSYLNLSNHSEDDLTEEFFVTGSASLGQIMDMTHYGESQQKLKLNFWRRLGYVNWTKRPDNNGCNYIVYATPQDDVKKKAAPDKDLSERGKKGAEVARQKRSADLEGRNGERHGVAINSPSPEGQPIQTAGSADLDSQGQPNRKARSADSEANRPSRSATLELRSGTGSGTVDLELLTGTGGNQADKAQTTSDRSKSKATPRARSASSGTPSRTQPGASRHPDPSVDALASRPPVPPPPKPPVPLVDEELTALGHRFMVGDNKCEDCHWSAQTIRQRELTCTELQKKNEDNRREEQMEKARRAFS